MQFYRALPTNVRAMPLGCSPKVFVEEYFECWENPNRTTGKLYELATPLFRHWEQMLRDPNYEKDLNYVALCRRLYPLTEDPQALLKAWVVYADLKSSVKEELELLFFMRLRALKYYPKRAAPKMAEYVIAKDFRDRFKDEIIRAGNHPIDVPYPAHTFNAMVVENVHPDHLLLKNLGLDAWESYLLELLKLGMTAMEISALTHLPRKTFAEEENQIWHKLRTKWHQA
jgi:hypothetical protein